MPCQPDWPNTGNGYAAPSSGVPSVSSPQLVGWPGARQGRSLALGRPRGLVGPPLPLEGVTVRSGCGLVGAVVLVSFINPG